MEIDFVDIKIVGLEDEMTVESPDKPPLLYVFLRLSQTPPPLWQSCFRESRKVPRHPHWRKAWIDRRFIIVECQAAEIEKYHLADLRQDVAYANKCYREYLSKQPRSEAEKAQYHDQERQKLRDMKHRLSFD